MDSGNHGPVGPVDDIADLRITAGGQIVNWVRNPADTNAFQIEVPGGATSIDVSFKWLTPIDGSQGRVVVTDEMLNIQWEKAILYPAGYYARQITVQPTLRLPAGWQYGVALDTTSFQNGVAVFAPISLDHLADSPVFAGAHYRQIDLDPGGRSPVRMNLVADDPAMLAASDDHIALHRSLVTRPIACSAPATSTATTSWSRSATGWAASGWSTSARPRTASTPAISPPRPRPSPTATCWATNTSTRGTANGAAPLTN